MAVRVFIEGSDSVSAADDLVSSDGIVGQVEVRHRDSGVKDPNLIVGALVTISQVIAGALATADIILRWRDLYRERHGRDLAGSVYQGNAGYPLATVTIQQLVVIFEGNPGEAVAQPPATDRPTIDE
ncbi:hypothetical protein C1I95_15505 [Micromonospora craterilacus]|uniref:Uncharacterized protein n=1 Tax=Micromonospora craterilacus TaxID=1655439 RepID=A0A2W2FQX4_9ACTN|nr:hypothetical protein [Micromonospora craterilacus]PZG17464.1 hypothetical protein C1I95_15505 [Micromonospora craterilacus]